MIRDKHLVQMIPAQLVDALEMLGKDSVSTLDPTRTFYYSAFTPEGRLLWRVQLLSCGRRLEIFSRTA
ncbi:hypothetical protein Hanom_Chr05g00475261 [Helianthus anomalus]